MAKEMNIAFPRSGRNLENRGGCVGGIRQGVIATGLEGREREEKRAGQMQAPRYSLFIPSQPQ